ncbi:hypothetical protein MRB53_042321 [Persea americana]|nr:hypothetical protein MRB53_042321 [Persea americana]
MTALSLRRSSLCVQLYKAGRKKARIESLSGPFIMTCYSDQKLTYVSDGKTGLKIGTCSPQRKVTIAALRRATVRGPPKQPQFSIIWENRQDIVRIFRAVHGYFRRRRTARAEDRARDDTWWVTIEGANRNENDHSSSATSSSRAANPAAVSEIDRTRPTAIAGGPEAVEDCECCCCYCVMSNTHTLGFLHNSKKVRVENLAEEYAMDIVISGGISRKREVRTGAGSSIRLEEVRAMRERLHAYNLSRLQHSYRCQLLRYPDLS